MKPINSLKAKIGILEIAEELARIEHIQNFVDNITHLYPDKEMTLFEWWETYLAWGEVSTEKDMDMFYGDDEDG
jgi:hypothetical protein